MQRTVVIRTYGDMSMSKPIVNALVQPAVNINELNRLRAELGVSKYSRSNEHIARLREAKVKYHVEPVTGIKAKLLGLLGLVILLKGEFN